MADPLSPGRTALSLLTIVCQESEDRVGYDLAIASVGRDLKEAGSKEAVVDLLTKTSATLAVVAAHLVDALAHAQGSSTDAVLSVIARSPFIAGDQ